MVVAVVYKNILVRAKVKEPKMCISLRPRQIRLSKTTTWLLS